MEHAPDQRHFRDYINFVVHSARVVPILLRYGRKSTREMLDSLGFKDERLKYFFTRLMKADDLSSVGFLGMLGWGHDHNAGYLMGGSQAMA